MTWATGQLLRTVKGKAGNRRAALLACTLTAACSGQIVGSTDEVGKPGPAPIRRMTNFEYDNTIRDLLGDTTHPAANFGAEEEALGFNNNAANLVTSTALAEKYMHAAEEISVRATAKLASLFPCPPDLTESGCAEQFIDWFGRRGFRRPLESDEKSELFALYRSGRTAGDFASAIQLVIQSVLQSPQFLYRVELGLSPETPESPAVALNSYELASRLSYFLWGSMPDDALLAAAGKGQLASAAELAAQARRMLSDSRAHDMVSNFHAQWLDTYRIASVARDVALFPDYTAAIGTAMEAETRAFIDHVIFNDEGKLPTLLGASYSFMNGPLAKFYGVPGPTGTAFERVSLDPAQRAGILTMGALLTINAHSNQTSPVHRGKLVRERFLCANMPPPPPGVVTTLPSPAPDSTVRQRSAQHAADPACAGCHKLMDPIGLGFESYDAVGRFRSKENGQPIDVSGELTATDRDGTFDGVVGLASRLATSPQVADCYLTQWFRYAYGRGEVSDDSATLQALRQHFADTGGDIKELLIAMTQTAAFRFRPAGVTP